jgi:2-polyprenyl-6-methoxyphenol hydroxylase-like FAD-dependent oxidoreductase
METTDSSVIIVGAGPVGLMLAGELRLSGVNVAVYERRLTRSGESRGVGFTTRAAETFAQRGLLERFGEVEITRQGHFGGIPMDFGVLAGSNFGARGIPQYRVEEMLENWVHELGGEVYRGYEVTQLQAGPDGVTVVIEGPDGPIERTAEYLVGCDGGHSSIRRMMGFDFPGADAVREMYMADVVGAEIKPRPIGERVPGGMVMSGRLEPGVDRIIVCPIGTPPSNDRSSANAADVAAAWERLTGESLAGAEFTWVSAFTDATRQVTEYRRGRVLLAGDAAHIHLPAGGQGMSLGLQDAANLGWKLAATIHGWAPDGLLDSYHAERHPVGARVLRNTLAQGMLYLSGNDIDPLRSVMAELVAMPDVGRHLSGMVSGVDISYDVGATGHPLLGRRLPDAELELSDGRRIRISELLRQARGVLISTEETEQLSRLAAGWHDRIDLVTVRRLPAATEGTATESVLIRPDGYVAWAAPAGGELSTALRRWFGTARVTAEVG